MTDAEKFLARFRAFGAKPDPDATLELFDARDGTVLHPGMREPLHRDHVRAYMSAYLAAMPGFRFEVLRHAVAGDTIFSEATGSAAPAARRSRGAFVIASVCAASASSQAAPTPTAFPCSRA